MDWKSLLSHKRLGTDAPEGYRGARSEFERDADRVIYSGAFRRLSRKTQVHPLVTNDHVHTRLTHSIETGQVGRALAKAIFGTIHRDLPEDISANDLASILQAACLAHDIGNPPFGHAGEEALSHWFDVNWKTFKHLGKAQFGDLRSFDGNAQGFRVLSQLENHIFRGGLRLTYATLASFLKYPTVSGKGVTKFSAFLSEKAILEEVAEEVGLKKVGNTYLRHPLAYLVEAADDICYCVLDLEDAVELKIISFDEVEHLLLGMFENPDRSQIRSRFAEPRMFRVNLARMRGPVFDRLVQAAVDGFILQYDDVMNDRPSADVFSALGDDARAAIIPAAKKMGTERIYNDAKKVEVELGSFATLDTLLSELTAAARETAALLTEEEETDAGWKTRLVMSLLGDHAPRRSNAPPGKKWTEYQCHRRVLDFISGMTDNYAVYIAKQLNGAGFSGQQRP